MTSAADSGSLWSAGCSDSAAVDGDVAARTFLSAADSGCKSFAGCGDSAAVDSDVAARSIRSGAASAADSGSKRSYAGCGDSATVDSDVAARLPLSAADSGCLISAGCSDIAAVDGDVAAGTEHSAADSGCLISAGCGDSAAVDGDVAAGTTIFVTISAADSGSITSAGYGQRSHVFLDRLGINSKTVVLCHIDAAVGGQACAICQNQMNLAADGDPSVDGHSAVDYIPAAIPCGHAAFHHSDIICCLFTAVFVQIGNAVLRQ